MKVMKTGIVVHAQAHPKGDFRAGCKNKQTYQISPKQYWGIEKIN